jgi:hypothetical protein
MLVAVSRNVQGVLLFPLFTLAERQLSLRRSRGSNSANSVPSTPPCWVILAPNCFASAAIIRIPNPLLRGLRAPAADASTSSTMGRCCRGRHKTAAAADAATAAIQPQKKKRRRPLYDLAMRQGLSSDCCSSALWACAYREPWGHPPGLFHWRLGKTMPVFGNSFPFWFHGTFLFGWGRVLVPKPLS